MRIAAVPGLVGEKAPELRTDRLLLRRARESDLEPLHAIFTDAQTMAHWSTPVHASLDQSRAWLRSMIEGGDTHVEDFIIEYDGEAVGKVGAYQLPEFGILVRRDLWGMGLASEALEAYIDYMRARGMPYLVADVDPANKASLRIMEKAGFARSGFEAEAMEYDGRMVDSVFLRRDL
ncbi:GNAT family N-acetyltransferase [Sphingomicrobium sp. XHP0235]|uniref:GNAT family N-acetyltransferase n=1 Tax=Sphingomicrobium aquimarinum TaxID=3133971 RepID=UPI0031FE6611